MDYDLNEFLEEYDQRARFIQSSDHNNFLRHLKKWLALLSSGDGDVAAHISWLKSRIAWDNRAAEIMPPPSGMIGSGRINYPDDDAESLSVNLHLFSRIASGEIEPNRFCLEYAYKSSNLNDNLSHMIQQFFEPFAADLRRYIRRNFDEPVPDGDDTPTQVPASDRIVHVNHNSDQYRKTEAEIHELIELLRSTNDYDDPDDKAQRISELEASAVILKAPKIRLALLKTLLLDCLSYLAKKLGDGAAAELAKRLAAFVLAWLWPSWCEAMPPFRRTPLLALENHLGKQDLKRRGPQFCRS